jgi:chorismate mutase
MIFGSKSKKRIKELEAEIASLRGSLDLLDKQLQAMIEEKMKLERYIARIRNAVENIAKHFQLPFYEEDVIRSLYALSDYTNKLRDLILDFIDVCRRSKLDWIIASVIGNEKVPEIPVLTTPTRPTTKSIDEMEKGIERLMEERKPKARDFQASLTPQLPSPPPSIPLTSRRPLEQDPVKMLSSIDSRHYGKASQVFAYALLGYNDDWIAKTLGIKKWVVEMIVEDLEKCELLDEASLYIPEDLELELSSPVHFPTAKGLVVCERTQLMRKLIPCPWHIYQYNYLRSKFKGKRKKFPSHGEMVNEVKGLLSRAGYRIIEGVVEVEVKLGERPSWLESVRPDFLLARNERLVPVEVETLSNNLNDLTEKVRKYSGEVIPLFIVVNKLAKRMLLSRIAFCLETLRLMLNNDVESFEFSIISCDEIRDLVISNKLDELSDKMMTVLKMEVNKSLG